MKRQEIGDTNMSYEIIIRRKETLYNRASRRYEYTTSEIGKATLKSDEMKALRECARCYQFTIPETVSLIFAYYFGDGKNHFGCQFCDFWNNDCKMPMPGVQTTLPILD